MEGNNDFTEASFVKRSKYSTLKKTQKNDIPPYKIASTFQCFPYCIMSISNILNQSEPPSEFTEPSALRTFKRPKQ